MILGQFAISTFSTLTAAAIAALISFLFRNKIRKMLRGLDLLAPSHAPAIEFVDMQYITDLNYNKNVSFLIKNCGSVDISNIKLFNCIVKNAGNPTSLSIVNLPYERHFTKISQNDGEVMQIAVGTEYFKQDYFYPDSRLFIEMTSEDGSCFRATIIRAANDSSIDFREGGFFTDHIGRVRKPLPPWKIETDNTAKIERLVKRYSIDLSVG